MNLLHDITPGSNVPNEINVIVEINKGSKNKYELDKETGMIKLDRVMHTSQDFPFDYGFVPQSLWHDGDPLDVVIVATYPLIPGVLVTVRPVGVLHMIKTWVINWNS
jgi:inorganic pyrophosphatase